MLFSHKAIHFALIPLEAHLAGKVVSHPCNQDIRGSKDPSKIG
jgi:hypothetical protein